jgi:hypothetical protein
LCVSGLDGTCFAPLGRARDFPTGRNEDVGSHLTLGRERWYSIDGACEIPLPAGVPLRVRATRGPEFKVLDEVMTLGAGQMALRFAIERWTDMRADGWMSVDARCHFLAPHATLLDAAAEAVDVANLLIMPYWVLAQDGHSYVTTPNLHAFSGQTPALEADGHSVVVNTLNAHPVLGKVALLHSHRLVLPLTFGGEESDDWSICDWCDQCHRKGGLAVWVEAFEPAGGAIGGEALVAAILGKIDAIEVASESRKIPLLPWVYRLWDAGYRLALVGASGKDSNRIAVGRTRTYARLEGETWVEAVRGGRTFVTDGPLLNLECTGRRIRASLRVGSSPGSVEIVANGRVVAAGEGGAEVMVEEPAWVAARCQLIEGGFAHTSAAAVGTPEGKPDARSALARCVEQTREWIETHGRFTIPKRKAALIASCEAALAKLAGSS